MAVRVGALPVPSRVTVCAVRVDCTDRSALDSPSTEPGLPPSGVVALTTEVSAEGVIRDPGMFSVSWGRP